MDKNERQRVNRSKRELVSNNYLDFIYEELYVKGIDLSQEQLSQLDEAGYFDSSDPEFKEENPVKRYEDEISIPDKSGNLEQEADSRIDIISKSSDDKVPKRVKTAEEYLTSKNKI